MLYFSRECAYTHVHIYRVQLFTLKYPHWLFKFSLNWTNVVCTVFQHANGSLSSATKISYAKKYYNTLRIKEGMTKGGTATYILEYNEGDEENEAKKTSNNKSKSSSVAEKKYMKKW